MPTVVPAEREQATPRAAIPGGLVVPMILGEEETMDQSTGYAVAILRKGQDAQRLTTENGGELRTIVYDVIRSEGSEINGADHAGLTQLIGQARSMADLHGFAALKFGEASITIRPGGA